MKTTILTSSVLALLILSACKESDGTKETPAELKDSVVQKLEQVTQEAAPLDSAAEAKAWEDYMTPNEMHKMMASWNGKWSAEQTSWMAEGAPAMGPNKMEAEYKMLVGGRYQDGWFKGTMMGMPFEGRSVMAYDNAKKKFTSFWMDNFGTGFMYTEGEYDAASKSMVMTGKMMDPAKVKETDIRQVYKIVDDKHQVLEMYCQGKDGKEYKNMEIKFTRK